MISTRLSLSGDGSLLGQSFPKRKPKGSFPSLDDGQSATMIPGMDPSITSSTPRKRKRRKTNNNNLHHSQSSNSSSSTKSTLALLGRLWSTSCSTLLPHLALNDRRGSSSLCLRKRRRFDWNVLKTLRAADTGESSDEDELPLMMEFMDETTLLDEMSLWDPNEMVSTNANEGGEC